MLRDYQIDLSIKANALLQKHKIAYLSMQVRTGKTMTSLATAELYGATSVLFLTKKKAISSIMGDYNLLAPRFTVTILNYEQLKNLSGKYDLVILDEAHCLGQYPIPAKKIHLLKALCNGLPIIYLSGTPTPESYSQIYHQFFISSFSPFAQYSNFYRWAKDYVRLKTKFVFNRSLNDYSDADQSRIRIATGHLFLSFTQAEAGIEQDVQETVLKVEMKRSTMVMANRLKANRVLELAEGDTILGDTNVKLMQKLHQMYSGSCLTENGNALLMDDSKAHYIKHRFRNERIGIFYKFKAELRLLQLHFGDILTDSPEAFSQCEGLVFVSQIQSGREGINLSSADAIIMFNIDFSSVSYQQARARMQAKGRIKPCHLYWIFADGGIEEKIYKRVINKQDYTLTYFKKDYL